MKKHSKRYLELEKKRTKTIYSLEDAIQLLKEFGTAKFLESVEAHIKLNIDPKYANQQLRTSFVLPHGTGKTSRIAIFTEPDSIEEIRKLGATLVGADELLEDMSQGKLNFDILITTPKLMPKLTRLGKILGPKGLMPSPKSGTVTTDLKQALSEFQKGKLEYRADKTGIVHIPFGKTSFSKEKLLANALATYESIEKNKPIGVKGKYFQSFAICSTMSPGIEVDLTTFKFN
jgi:large subunit ribosomal protein L1